MSEEICAVKSNLEQPFKRNWRPWAAYIYLFICTMDFVGLPVWVEYSNQQVNSAAFAEIRALDDKEVQLKAIEHLDLGRAEWKPLTLEGSGLFHLSFGAILGVSAWTRGQEKKAAIENGR